MCYDHLLTNDIVPGCYAVGVKARNFCRFFKYTTTFTTKNDSTGEAFIALRSEKSTLAEEGQLLR